jgi:hypothetical protein
LILTPRDVEIRHFHLFCGLGLHQLTLRLFQIAKSGVGEQPAGGEPQFIDLAFLARLQGCHRRGDVTA